MKKIIALILAAVMVLALCACGQTAAPAPTAAPAEAAPAAVAPAEAPAAEVFPELKISFANSYSDTDMVNTTMKDAAAKIAERTNGKVQIEVFPNNTLGATSDMLATIDAGAPLIFVCGFTAFADSCKDVNTMACPFVFQSAEELYRFFKTDAFDTLVAKLDDAGVHALNCTYIGGLRHVIGQKAYTTPEEIKGLKLRTPADTLFLTTFESIGAAPIGMPAGEQMAALSAGTVDALDQSISLIYSTKSYDLVKHVTLLGQMPLADSCFCSAEWWNSLPENVREIINEELVAAATVYYNYTVENEVTMREELEAAGVEFHEVDTAPFAEMSSGIIKEYEFGQTVLDTVAQIRADIAAGK